MSSKPVIFVTIASILNLSFIFFNLRLISQQNCQKLFEHASHLRSYASESSEDCQFSKSLAKLDHVNYHHVYERFFCKLKSQKFTMIEIGTGGYGFKSSGGEGLNMFIEYFPQVHIVSLDINEKNIQTPPRTTLIKGDQTDTSLLKRLCNNYQDVKLIIDDGSHNSPDIILTFEHLWPCLKNGGIYVVEDTQTSYWPGSGSCDLGKPNTTMNYFKKLADEQNFKEIQRPNPAFRNHPFASEILGLHFYHNLILIEKGDNSLETNLVGWGTSFWQKC